MPARHASSNTTPKATLSKVSPLVMRAKHSQTNSALGDWGIPGGPEVFSTRCPPLPRLRMRESREIVHRAVLRAKGLDPELVSPSATPVTRTPATRSGRRMKKEGKRDGAGDGAGEDDAKEPGGKDSSSLLSSQTQNKTNKSGNMLDEHELESLLPKSRGAVGGGGGGDYLKGVGAMHHLRVRHEVGQARLTRRVRLALVDPNYAPEVDAVDAASEMPSLKAQVRIKKNVQANAAYAPRRKAPLGFAGKKPQTVLPLGVEKPTGNTDESGSNPGLGSHQKQRMAPSIAYGFRVAAAKASAAVLGAGSKTIGTNDEKRATAGHDPVRYYDNPRTARLSASLRALIADAPTHVAAAVNAVAFEKELAKQNGQHALAKTLTSLANRRNVLFGKNQVLETVLEKLQDELQFVTSELSGEQGSEVSLGSALTNLTRTHDELLKQASEESETTKSRQHTVDRLRETIGRLKQGVEGVRETICDANYDLNSCRAYAEDAVGVDRQATEALEWIKKKYLVKANGWKRDLEGVKLGRERIAEELREARADDRRRCAKELSQKFVNDTLLDTLRGSEQSVARDLDSRKSSEDECHRKLIRVAVSLGLTAPQDVTPSEIVAAVEASKLRRVDALAQVETLTKLEQIGTRKVQDGRDALRRARLGLVDDFDISNLVSSGFESWGEPDRDVSGGSFGNRENLDGNLIGVETLEDVGVETNGPEGFFDTEKVFGVDETKTFSDRGTTHIARASTGAGTGAHISSMEIALRATNRKLTRRFNKFKQTVSLLVAVDEGLRKMTQAVKRVVDRVDGVVFPVTTGDSSHTAHNKRSARNRFASAVKHVSVAGRAAENMRRTSSFAAPTARRPSSAVGTRLPSISDVGGVVGDETVSGGSPGQQQRGSLRSFPRERDGSVFDRLTNAHVRTSVGVIQPIHETEAAQDEESGGGGETTLNNHSKPSADITDAITIANHDLARNPTDAASVAMRGLERTLQGTLDTALASVMSVVARLPKDETGGGLRGSVFLGGARDDFGGLRGGAFLGEFSRINTPGGGGGGGGGFNGSGGNALGGTSNASSGHLDSVKFYLLLCARPGKVPVAAGEVDDDPARMRLKRGRAYREMAMKWCFRAGRPIADENDEDDDLHAVAGSDGVLRFGGEGGGGGGVGDTSGGGGGGDGNGGSSNTNDGTNTGSGGGALDLARAANVGLSAVAFRRLVARTRKAQVVPTRADLKKASRRATEKMLKRLEILRLEKEEE